jgi:hypothetical protein
MTYYVRIVRKCPVESRAQFPAFLRVKDSDIFAESAGGAGINGL